MEKVLTKDCANCNTEIGGYYGNKVYRYLATDLCVNCGNAQDPTVKLCKSLTGMTPVEYQAAYGSAWNE